MKEVIVQKIGLIIENGTFKIKSDARLYTIYHFVLQT